MRENLFFFQLSGGPKLSKQSPHDRNMHSKVEGNRFGCTRNPDIRITYMFLFLFCKTTRFVTCGLVFGTFFHKQIVFFFTEELSHFLGHKIQKKCFFNYF